MIHLPGGIRRRLDLYSGQAQVDGRVEGALLPGSSANPLSTLHLGQQGWREEFRLPEFSQVRLEPAQAAIAFDINTGGNYRYPALSLNH